MYCILVTGIPAAGKSTMASALGRELKLPVISKDTIKELLFDSIGFQSREEKVKLGTASMEIMYYIARQLMAVRQPFILENNFENVSKDGLLSLLSEFHYPVLTITLTGEYSVIYQRFLERNSSPDRHRGHVVNDCYPERHPQSAEKADAPPLSYADYVSGIAHRGFDRFSIGGKQIRVDTTDFSKLDMASLLTEIEHWRKNAMT